METKVFHSKCAIFAPEIQSPTDMKTTLLVIGRTVEKHYITAIGDYVQRTKHFMPFDMEVIPELKNTGSLTMEQQKEKEGELFCNTFQSGDVIVLLDEHGKELRSVEFAGWMEKKMTTVNKRLVFVVGGPYGFSQKVYQAAHEKISLSRMTFSHQMIRLIFVEQLYRAMSILHGDPYHHE
jgi:23S rRNA (pseudouridine1915-N3)-methyltransferase